MACSSRSEEPSLKMYVDPAQSAKEMLVISFDDRDYPTRRYLVTAVESMAGYVVDVIKSFRPDQVFVDCRGVGNPLIDRLQYLGFRVEPSRKKPSWA